MRHSLPAYILIHVEISGPMGLGKPAKGWRVGDMERNNVRSAKQVHIQVQYERDPALGVARERSRFRKQKVVIANGKAVSGAVDDQREAALLQRLTGADVEVDMEGLAWAEVCFGRAVLAAK